MGVPALSELPSKFAKRWGDPVQACGHSTAVLRPVLRQPFLARRLEQLHELRGRAVELLSCGNDGLQAHGEWVTGQAVGCQVSTAAHVTLQPVRAEDQVDGRHDAGEVRHPWL